MSGSGSDSAHDQSPKTPERYAELARNQILAYLGEHPLQKLKPEHIQAWHSTLLKAGLSRRTISHANKLLRLEAAEGLRADILAVMGKLADQEVKELLIADARRVLAGEGKPRHDVLQAAKKGTVQ